MSPMMEARAIKSPDEIKAFQMVGSICDNVHYEITNYIKPGMTENQVAAFGFEKLYSIPGMEDVEDVIVSSGPNAWPNWRNFSDRMIRPGELVIVDLAALTWNGFKSCCYRTYCVGGKPTDEHQKTYDAAHKWLWDSIEATKPGVTTADVASKWPSAKEAWGYEEEDQAAANNWGHGLGLAQYDPPVISRIWSLDHPVEIEPGHDVRARDPERQAARPRRPTRGDALRHRHRHRDGDDLQATRDHRRRLTGDGRRQTADGSQSSLRPPVGGKGPAAEQRVWGQANLPMVRSFPFRPSVGGKGPAAEQRVGGLANSQRCDDPSCHRPRRRPGRRPGAGRCQGGLAR